MLQIFILLLAVGCRHGEKKNVYLERDTDCFSLQEFADSIVVIPLASSDADPLVKGGFYATAYCDSLFFVLDRFSDFSIRVFNPSGKLISKLCRQGSNEGEYVMAYDLLVDESAGLLVVLDPTGKIVRYSLSTGFPFVDEMHFVDYLPAAHNICLVSSGVYALFSLSAEYQLYICKFKDQTISHIRYSVPDWLLFSPFMAARSPFYTYDGHAYFFDELNGSISRVEEQRLTPYLRWDMGEYALEESMLPPGKTPKYYMTLLNKSSYRFATQFTAAQETDRFVIMRFTFRNQGTVLVYDKLNNDVRTFYLTTEGMHFIPGPLHKQSMFLLIHRDDLPRYVPKKQIPDGLHDNYVILEYKCR